jgi:hypothetical protein
MGLIEDISRMKSRGLSEQEIAGTLSAQGLSPEAVSEAMSRADIKRAVSPEKTEDIKEPFPFQNQMGGQYQMPENNEEMQPSIMNQPEAPQESQEAYASPQYPQQYEQTAPLENYPQQSYDYGQQYQQYSSGVSADTISEIAEQVASEKLSSIKKSIEKVIDFKTALEAKMESLDERLKRIEKIIDRLQLSVLQKVGEYVANVEDLKKDLAETQKTFKSVHHSHKS